jgi:hypothetical protein
MLIEQVVERCFDKQIYAVYQHIAEDTVPLAILGLGPPEVVALIAVDGSAVVIEHGVLSEEFGTIRVTEEGYVIERVVSAPEIFDMSPGKGLHTISGDFPMMLSIRNKPTVIYLNPAAKMALGFEENAEIGLIRERFRTQDYDVTPIIGSIMKVSNSLDNPLFIPKDIENFTIADVEVIVPLLKDVLTLQSNLAPGDYTLRAAWPAEDIKVTLRDEDENDLPEACLETLRRLVDLDVIFFGVVYERIGRGGTRMADFDPQGATVATIEIEQKPSRHDLIAAWKRLEVALLALGAPADEMLRKLSKKP